MKRMTPEQLYNYLNSPEFQNTDGNMCYNYNVYQYPANEEYSMRRNILEFKELLERPSTYIKAMTLDLFEAFCDYLHGEPFGNTTLLSEALEGDKTSPDLVTEELTTEANSDYFMQYINELIEKHLSAIDDGLRRPYIFVYGIGKMFPYLRANVFLTKYEPYNETSRYKIILFYPGHQEGNSFSLFDCLTDSHTYRATLLVNK